MDATALCSPLLPPQPSSSSVRSRSRCRKIELQHRKRSSGSIVFAIKRDSYDWNFGGRLVDESMIVLRKRIHEMKMVERNYDPPADWMEWEKQYYTSYDSSICNAVGLLQAQLMDMRPSLALGIVALVSLSVPVSTIIIMLHLIEAGSGILSGFHLY